MNLTVIRLSDDLAMAAVQGRGRLWDSLPPPSDELSELLFMSDWVWEAAEAAGRITGMGSTYDPIFGGTVVVATDPLFRFWPTIQVRDLAAFSWEDWSPSLGGVTAEAIRDAGVEVPPIAADDIGDRVVDFFAELGAFIRLANSRNESLAVDIG